ncbi:OB-fold domain-containing protein [Nocardioides sp. QY071]|uniref:OB-fold domain-containing protein n=1 Tax=Nocardioides sp. QY071 TaxID=3044187 RepID=UPI00249A9C1B|nr:OB-fold domain-containing protein [Nocardioides sp. QY071]WGY00397.1 OB-fold domain-containing protein [Nocardioides sp. QY071]
MQQRCGISAYGTYLPYWRLDHSTIAEALGGTARGPGARTVAGYDEDTTTMAVEAARRALGTDTAAAACTGVVLATTAPVYAEKTNATALHAALGLSEEASAADANGSVRSGVSALLGAIRQPGATLVAASDLRIGPGGSPEERSSGDAATAFLVGDGLDAGLVAELVGSASLTREFLDRWRRPEDPWAATWEERFGEEVYSDLGARSLAAALASAGLTPGDVDRIAVVGLSPRAAAAVQRSSGIAKEAAQPDLTGTIGNCGAAHPGLALAAMLDDVGPDAVVVLTVLADGADTLVLRTTAAHHPQGPTVAAQVGGPTGRVGYADYLSWRGLLRRQQPRRPDPDRAVAPATNRQVEWKFSFSASTCEVCGVRHMPPQQVCMGCGTVDRMRLTRLSETKAAIATYTVDHLAYSPAPPVIGAVLDFDGGGRFQCELTDIDLDSLAVGRRVEMTFRHISDAEGIRNYFWKARPLHEEDQA